MSKNKHAMVPLRKIRTHYEGGGNIIEMLRTLEGGNENSTHAVRLSYDIQAGSYIKMNRGRAAQELLAVRAQEIVKHLQPLSFDSLLEAGCGDGTMLTAVLQRIPAPKDVLAFDLSWSRASHARAYTKAHGFPVEAFMGNMEQVPLPDNACDVVFTSHAIEPNGGKETILLAELHRIARRHVALFEPCYELALPEQKAHMDRHGYCRDLPAHAQALGFKVLCHKPIEALRDRGATALLLLEKQEAAPAKMSGYACPICHEQLRPHLGHWFCQECGLVYPVIADVPCLDPTCGILATHYLAAPDHTQALADHPEQD